MSDKLGFLSGDVPSEVEDTSVAEAEAPAPEQVAAETPPAEPTTPQERPRGPDGKFAPAATEEAPTGVPKAAPTAVESGQVPIGVMLEVRDKWQADKKELAELRARISAQTATEPVPLDVQLQQGLYKANLDNSRKWAVKEYGKEAVDKAFEWANARCEPSSPTFDPVFNQQVANSGDPYETAVQAYNREQLLTEAGQTDLAEFRAWKAAQAAAGQPPPIPVNPSPPPPRSLAAAPGTGALGKDIPPEVGDGVAFRSVIPS